MPSLARWLVLCCALAVAIGCTPAAPRSAAPGDETAAGVAAGKAEETGHAAAPAAPAADKKPETAPADPAGQAAPLSPECAELWKQIEALDARIPMIFMGLRRAANDIHKDMVSLVELARRFLSTCPGAPQQCDVKAALARTLLARHRRYQEELKQQGLSDGDARLKHGQYLDEVFHLADEVVRDCPLGSQARITALRVLIDIYEQRGEYAKLRQRAEQLLTERPEYQWRPNVHIAEAQSYLNERKYREGVTFLDEVIKKHSSDPEYVAYLEKLFDALTGVGDLERMEELWQLILAEFPVRIPELPKDSYFTGYYETSLCIAEFWLGFVKMALAEHDEARRHFRAQIEVANDVQKGVKKQSQIQSNVCLIFRDMRSADLLYWLDNHLGKPAAPALDVATGITWVSEQKLTPSDLSGKVVAILARMPENPRAASFLQELDALVKSHGKDGFVAIAVGFLSGVPNAASDAQLLEKMRQDHKRLDVTIPSGFEADRTSHKLFHGLHLTLGTASFVLLNRKGEQAWFLADPRDMDRGITRRVIERLLSEKPEGGNAAGGAGK